MEGVDKLAGLHGIGADEFLRDCEIVLHGTTVATNAVVELRGAKVGVLTSRGHRDTLPVMRGSGRSKGLPVDQMLHASRQAKPRPVAERSLILELNERVDAAGQAVVALDDAEVEARVRELVDAGVSSIAVCLLWSVANPEHERRVADAVRRIAPAVHVTCSHEVSSRSGEYERFAATAINAFIGPESADYMRRLSSELDGRGCTAAFLIMQASGGVVPAEGAAGLPILTIGSGPSAGAGGERRAGRPPRRAQRHHRRHGRHQLRRRPGRRRPAGARQLDRREPVRVLHPARRHRVDRLGRRQRRPLRRGQPHPAGGADERGRRPGAGLLRQGRRPARRSPTPTCCWATSTPTTSSAARSRSTAAAPRPPSPRPGGRSAWTRSRRPRPRAGSSTPRWPSSSG